MKDPDRSHFVQRFKFDFEIERREDATRLQNELFTLFNQKISRIVDRILTEFDDPAFITRLPTIELDLGELPEAGMEKEVLIRFEKEFRKEIRMRMGEMGLRNAVIPSERGEQIALAPAKMEVLSYFLANGRMPLGAEKMAGQVEKLFMELAGAEPEGLRRMLQALAKSAPAAIKRIATTFSERLVKKVYQLTTGHSAGAVAAYEKKMAEQTAKATGGSERMVRVEMRQQILSYLLLQSPSGGFRMQNLQRHAAERMVKKYGAAVNEVFKGSLGKAAEEEAATDRDAARLTEGALDVVASAMRGTLPAGSVALIDAWEYLLAHDIGALRRTLAQRLQRPEGLAMLAEIVSATMMRDFVQKLLPTGGLRLIQAAATVVSAHALYEEDAAEQQRIGLAAYAALVHAVAEGGGATPALDKVVATIRQHLQQIQRPPTRLLEAWEAHQFAAPPTPANRPANVKAQREQEEQTQKSKKQSEKARKAEEKRRLQAEMEELARQERAIPETEEERRAAIERSRKARSGEASLEDAELQDDAFFQRGKEGEERPVSVAGQEMEDLGKVEELSPEQELFQSPILESEAAKLELLMLFLATGKAPWWATRFMPVQVEIMVKQVMARNPDLIHEMFTKVAKSLPAARYQAFAARIVQFIEPKTLENLVPILAGDLGGFAVTVRMALEAIVERLPDGVPAPTTPAARKQFVWVQQLRYLMAYASSSPSPQQMLRYVLKEQAAALGVSGRKLIEWVGEAAEDRIALGERRFAAVKSMLPKVFEGLEVAPPTPHEVTADTIAFQRTLLDAAPAPAVETPKEKPDAGNEKSVGREEDPQRKVEPSQEAAPEQYFDLEGKPLAKDAQGRPLGTDGKPLPLGPDGKPTLIGPDGKARPFGPDGKPLALGPDGKPVPPEKAPFDLHKKFQEMYGPKAIEEQAAPPPPEAVPYLDLSPEEEAELGLGEDWVIDVVRHYLEQGSLSPTATARFSPDTLKATVRQLLGTVTRETVAMLRAIIGQRGVRRRLYAMGEDVVLQALALLNISGAERMTPYVKELLQVFKGGGSPVPKEVIFEHAVRFVASLNTTFVPINYVKDFFDYVAMQPSTDVKEAIHWAHRKLEHPHGAVQNSLLEMLDVVQRIEEVREERAKKGPAPAKAPATPRVSKPLTSEIYVSNAGIGILQLHFIQLFKAYKLITPDRKAFESRQAQVRAIHQIQYLCYREVDSPEEKMVMAKLIVGWGLSEPVDPLEVPLNNEDFEDCDSIWQMVLNQWSVMKNAGADYVREKFILRSGRLRKVNDTWTLKVEESGLDILKRKIPWPTNPIRMPWNNYIIEVEWE